MKVLHNQHKKESRDFVKELRDKNPDFDYEIINYPDCVNEYEYISKFPSVLIDCPEYYDEENDNDVPKHEEYATSRAVEDADISFIDAVIERQERVNRRAEENTPEGADTGPPSDIQFQIAQRPKYSDLHGNR